MSFANLHVKNFAVIYISSREKFFELATHFESTYFRVFTLGLLSREFADLSVTFFSDKKISNFK